MNVLNGFGKRLKRAVKDSPYTQKQLSEIIRIDQDTFTNYTKEKSFPDARVLFELCQLLNKAPNWLLTGEDRFSGEFLHEEQSGYIADEILPLSDDERNILLKYRLFDYRDQLDIKEMVDIKYNRMVKRGKSSGSGSGGKSGREEAASKEYA